MPEALKVAPLWQRVVTALIGAPLLVAVCLWGARPFAALMVLLALVARSELHRAYRRSGLAPNGFLSLLGALLPSAIFALSPSPSGGTFSAPLSLLLVLACALVVASLYETWLASESPTIQTGQNLAYGLLCGAYVSLFGGIALLRICPGGANLVLLTAACTMAGDSAAYFVGRAKGRHKLAAGISPKKTTEGLLGGMAASLLVGSALGYLLLHRAPFGLLVGALAGLLGPLGDLFKSALKRELEIKDFGTILPGHGGVLDRFDSLLFTAPVVVLIVTTGAGLQ